MAYGLAFFGRASGVSDRDELAFAVDEAGVIDLFEVVVFGRDPEHGHDVEALRAQVFGQLDRGQGLEHRVERAGEKPGLLARDDDHGIFLTKALDVGEGLIACASPRVLIGERVGHRVAREGLSRDLRRARDQGRNVEAAGLIEPRDAVEVVEKIVEEPGRARNLIKADRVVCHSFPLSLINSDQYGSRLRYGQRRHRSLINP